MARYTGPTRKLSRRIGVDLGHKTNSAKTAQRLAIPPGAHGRKGGKKLSDYGQQLKEKQKVKWVYGVLERQFRRYFEMALKNPSSTGSELLKILESRLDNVVYRLGFAPTRKAARQMISHGNVKVNEKKLSIPSYLGVPGDTIGLSDTAQKIPYITELLNDKKFKVPAWLERQAAVGRIKQLPSREDIDMEINEHLIVEHYSR